MKNYQIFTLAFLAASYLTHYRMETAEAQGLALGSPNVAITGSGVNTSSSNSRLQAEVEADKAAQGMVNKTLQDENEALKQEVADTQAEIAELRQLIVNIQNNAGGSSSSNSETSNFDALGDGWALPVTRSGIGSYSATCPAGYHFTGDYEATAYDHAGGVWGKHIYTSRHGSGMSVTDDARTSLTIYCQKAAAQ